LLRFPGFFPEIPLLGDIYFNHLFPIKGEIQPVKKIIFAFALTLVLSAGIASPISAAAQTKSVKTNPILITKQDGGMCDPFGNCFQDGPICSPFGSCLAR